MKISKKNQVVFKTRFARKQARKKVKQKREDEYIIFEKSK